jgi:hypothetical protein
LTTANILRRRDPRPKQTTYPILSLNEAWLRTLDRCLLDSRLSEVILPLMRNCFFAGAVYAILLLQKGHGDELASDISGFITEAASFVNYKAFSCAALSRLKDGST